MSNLRSSIQKNSVFSVPGKSPFFTGLTDNQGTLADAFQKPYTPSKNIAFTSPDSLPNLLSNWHNTHCAIAKFENACPIRLTKGQASKLFENWEKRSFDLTRSKPVLSEVEVKRAGGEVSYYKNHA